jgi:hypothetical protein
LFHTQFFLRIFAGKKVIQNITFLPRSIRESANSSKKYDGAHNPLQHQPSLWILWNSTGDEGATGAVAVAMAAK